MKDREQHLDLSNEFENNRLTPFWYQEDCLDKLEVTRGRGKNRALVVMATGLGKTAVAAFDVENFMSSHPNSKVLFLCHQEEILNHAMRTFEGILGDNYSYGFYHGKRKANIRDTDIMFGTYQTLTKRLDRFEEQHFDYVIADESHHTQAETFKPVLDHFSPEFMLGITATPDRADLLDIREIFGKEVYSLPLEKALALNLLTQVDYRVMSADVSADKLAEIKTLDRASLNISLLDRELFQPQPLEEIVRIVNEKKEEIENPRIMIFTPSVEIAEEVANMMGGALPLHSKLKGSEQSKIFDQFRTGEVETVTIVDKFNEGVDIPEANIIVFLRSTSSRTVYFQQLGRGLRRSEGKDSVMVLDFVGNCARIQMVNELWSSVQQERKKMTPVAGGEGEKPLNIDIGRLDFSELSVDILDLIGQAQEGYTDEILIVMMQKLGEDLQRVPTRSDIDDASKEGLTASVETYRKYFGSLPAAQIASGFLPYVDEINAPASYEEEELINSLRNLYDKTGKVPTQRLIAEHAKLGEIPGPDVYYRRFGSLNDALRAAGLQPNVNKWTEDDMLLGLRQLVDDLGRFPGSRDIVRGNIRGICPSPGVYKRAFGSIQEALMALGYNSSEIKAAYKDKKTKIYTDEELLDFLRFAVDKTGTTPTFKALKDFSNKSSEYPSPATIVKRFGSYNKALDKIGLVPNHDSAVRSRDEMLEDLRKLSYSLGAIPTAKAIKKASKEGLCAGASTYRDHFGSIKNALEEAGLI